MTSNKKAAYLSRREHAVVLRDAADVLAALHKSNRYDLSKFTFDYSTSRIFYNGRPFEVKKERVDWSLEENYVLPNVKAFQDALYCEALKNTSDPPKYKDLFSEVIEQWLTDNNKEKVTLFDVITEGLKGTLDNAIDKSLEIRVAKCMQEIRWIKKHTKYGNFWMKPTDE